MAATHRLKSGQVDAALAVLRLGVGTVFIAHGAQKLFIFGVPGVVSGFAESGVPYAEIVGPVVAGLEFFGGVALVFGLLTRLIALALTIDMLGALYLVHLPNGFFLPNGFEFVLTLAAANVALLFAGAGAYSLDAYVASHRHAFPATVHTVHRDLPTTA